MPPPTPTVPGPVRNWAGNVTYTADRVHRPTSVEQLQRLVADADRLRVLGTGHSFNRLADTDGTLVTVADLPATVTVDPGDAGDAGGTAGSARACATVAAGVRYGDLVSRLHQAGYALPAMASLPHISVAGACATGTHGSGDRVGNLATAVSALELVTADGTVTTLRRDADGDEAEAFRAAVVGLGAFGVVTGMTLDLVPAFDVHQHVYEGVRHDTLAARFDEVFGAAYSVSVFTAWDGGPTRQVWLKHRAPARELPREWLGGRLADGPRHPVPGMPPAHTTDQLGALGPWYARLPHFRLDFTPSSGDELQSEYFVARGQAPAALAALAEVRHRIAPALQISEIRTIAGDDLWLSPAYGRDSVAFHFTWVGDEAAVAPAVAAVEEQLAPLGARPHWGKVFSLPEEEVRARYPRWRDAAALARHLDPRGVLRNDFVDRYLPG